MSDKDEQTEIANNPSKTLMIFVYATIVFLLILIFMQVSKVGYYREDMSDYKVNLCRNIAAHAPAVKANEVLVKCLAGDDSANLPEHFASERKGKIAKCREQTRDLKGWNKAKSFVSCLHSPEKFALTAKLSQLKKHSNVSHFSTEKLCDPSLNVNDCNLLKASGISLDDPTVVNPKILRK